MDIDFIKYFNEINSFLVKNIFTNSDLISPCAAAFFGALSAYWLNRRSEDIKEKNNNINNLNLFISLTGNQLNYLLTLKTDVLQPKINEFNVAIKKIEIGMKNLGVFKEITRFLIYQKFEIETSNSSFITFDDPNLYNYLTQTVKIIKTLENAIDEYNDYLKLLKQEDLITIDNLYTFESLIAGMEELLNVAIFMSVQLLNNLKTFGKNNYPKKLISVNFTDEQQKIIDQVPKIEGWTYKVKKLSFVDKNLPTFKKWFKLVEKIFSKNKSTVKEVLESTGDNLHPKASS